MGTIRLQPLDGQWETLGNGIFTGIQPHNIRPTWGANGSEQLNFDLSVDPRIPAIELAEFTPIEYERDGLDPVWSGYLMDSPAADQGFSVQALGWHRALEDQRRALFYVHRTLGDYVDVRSLLTSDLATMRAWGTISTDNGIVLTWPNATSNGAGSTGVAVVLDLGPDVGARRVIAEVETSANSAATQFFIIGSDTPYWNAGAAAGSNRQDYLSASGINTIGAGPAFVGGTVSGTHRYVTLMLWTTSLGTPTADIWIRIKQCMSFALPAYETGNDSALKASTVFTTEAAKNPFLSLDTSRITTTSLIIPALGGNAERANTHEILDRMNSYHAYRWGVDPDRRLYFEPQPAVPELSVNTQDDGVIYNDASRNSGDDEYNEVVVFGQSGSGQKLQVRRYVPGPPLMQGFAQVENPSATSSVSGWETLLTGTVTRDTSVFDSSPASARFTTNGSGQVFCNVGITGGAVPQNLYRGKRYRIRFRFRPQNALTYLAMYVSDGANVLVPEQKVPLTSLGFGVFNTITIDWTQTFDTAHYELVLSMWGTASTVVAYADDVQFGVPGRTILDRRNRVRTAELNCQAPMDALTMTILGDLYANLYSRPAMKGSLQLSAPTVYDTATGRRLMPAEVAARTGEMIRLADIADPYTGALGRDVQMVASSLTDETGIVEITLDQDRGSFDALMARFGVNQGLTN